MKPIRSSLAIMMPTEFQPLLTYLVTHLFTYLLAVIIDDVGLRNLR